MTSRWHSVESSNIEAICYEPNLLSVRFKNQTVYEYAGVPPELFQELLQAPSVGRVLNSDVKPFFPALKVLCGDSEKAT